MDVLQADCERPRLTKNERKVICNAVAEIEREYVMLTLMPDYETNLRKLVNKREDK